MMADVTGIPVVRSTTREATCLGAGILAAAAAGWFADVRAAAAAMTATQERYEPQPDRQAIYERLYCDVYRHLFPAVRPLVDRLTAITRGDAA
jgi:xylulokinase